LNHFDNSQFLSILKRALSNVAAYRDAAEGYVSHLKAEGYTAFQLQGPGDLDFILEWACMKNEILFNPAANSNSARSEFRLTLDEPELMTA